MMESFLKSLLLLSITKPFDTLLSEDIIWKIGLLKKELYLLIRKNVPGLVGIIGRE
jgi:hypothetical protein